MRSQGRKRVPVFLKIAPDLDAAELADIAAQVLEAKVEGVIVSNTTIARPALKSGSHRDEAGGLSGKPLFERSTMVLARMRRLLGPDVALIGVGGVDSAETAIEKIRAGADLVQLYTGMIYQGPSLPGRIVRGLAGICSREKVATIREPARQQRRPLGGQAYRLIPTSDGKVSRSFTLSRDSRLAPRTSRKTCSDAHSP